MSEDDLKTRLAVLITKFESVETRLEKMERNVNWATLLIVASVIAAILKQIGLS